MEKSEGEGVCLRRCCLLCSILQWLTYPIATISSNVGSFMGANALKVNSPGPPLFGDGSGKSPGTWGSFEPHESLIR
jgi:hypothetical protein